MCLTVAGTDCKSALSGFTNLKMDDIIGANATGATPAFIKSMKGKGHDFKNLEKYIELKSVLNN